MSQVLKSLLDAGSDVNAARADTGATPLVDLATHETSWDIIEHQGDNTSLDDALCAVAQVLLQGPWEVRGC